MAVLEQPRTAPPDVPLRIIHMATKASGYTVARCGKKRDRPIDPHAEGEMCVVCAELGRRA